MALTAQEKYRRRHERRTQALRERQQRKQEQAPRAVFVEGGGARGPLLEEVRQLSRARELLNIAELSPFDQLVRQQCRARFRHLQSVAGFGRFGSSRAASASDSGFSSPKMIDAEVIWRSVCAGPSACHRNSARKTKIVVTGRTRGIISTASRLGAALRGETRRRREAKANQGN